MEYHPDNCRFLTKSENSKWQRKTHVIVISGITDSALGWDSRLGFARGHINYLVRKNGLVHTMQTLQSHLDSNNAA